MQTRFFRRYRLAKLEARAGAVWDEDQHYWSVPTEDPLFEVVRGGPWPGWNMIELAVTGQARDSIARFFFEGSAGSFKVDLPLCSGGTRKRLVHVPLGTQRVRVCLFGGTRWLAFRHLRFAWLTPIFGRSRLASRLAHLHPAYQDLSPKQVWARLGQQARQMQWRRWDVAWQAYETTFANLPVAQSYPLWVEQKEAALRDRVPMARNQRASVPAVAEMGPLDRPDIAHFGILVPIMPEMASEAVTASLASVLAQKAAGWQAFLLLHRGVESNVQVQIHAWAREDDRLRVMEGGEGASGALVDKALPHVDAAFVMILSPGDQLDTEALWRTTQALARFPDADVLYSDEDQLDEYGRRLAPQFKPAWNPDLLLSTPYVGGGVLYRRDWLVALGGLGPHGRDGGKATIDYAALLRYQGWAGDEAGDRAIHIPMVLYHRSWRTDCPSASELTTLVEEHLPSFSPSAEAVAGRMHGAVAVRWPLPEPPPLVSLIIPTRDGYDILKPCVDAILEKTAYPHFEVLILDNQSRCPQTLAYLDALSQGDNRVRVLRWDRPFNFAAMNNWAASQAQGSIIGLVNNDVEPIEGDWLTEMVRQVSRQTIGCVGAKLLYPDETVQHGGVILGLGGVAGHAHRFFHRDEPGYMGRLQLVQNLSAVTAACLLVRKSVYEAVGGMNERDLPVAYNDVDLCLKVREAGYRNLWTPQAELYHHESVSRGEDRTRKAKARAQSERDFMRAQWGAALDADPAYNPNLTRANEDFSLR